MPQTGQLPTVAKINRAFEQSPDALPTYSDYAQVAATGSEVMLQFYQSTPGPPRPEGGPEGVTTRLKATIVLSHSHAKRLGDLLRQQLEAAFSPTEDLQ